MAPNIFLCLRTALCPRYWFQSGDSQDGALFKEEHWESPVPGTYRYIAPRGWHLIRRGGAEEDELEPRPVVYCRIIHRYVFSSDLEQRCRWHSVVQSPGAAPQRCLFFRLDDGYTWVVGWDSRGKFIPGPYRKWCYDKEVMTMRHMTSCEDSLASTSRSSSIVP